MGMKIGFFSDTFLPQINGVVTSMQGFGQELVNRGHEVYVYCPKSNVKQDHGMMVHDYPSITFRPYPEYKVGFPLKTSSVADLDIVHSHSPFTFGVFALRVAKRRNIPAIGTYHTVMKEYTHYVSPRAKPALRKIADAYVNKHFNNYDRVIVPSESIKQYLSRVKKPIAVLPSGISGDFKGVSQKEARKQLGITQKHVYLYLGRISKEKSIDIVLDAANGFLDGDSVLFIVGKGPLLDELKKRSKDPRIVFTGFVTDEQKRLYFSAADVFISASKTETQGLVAIEAMACGTPVVVANALALPDAVKNGYNGYTFKPDDPEDLARKVKKIKTLMKKNARETAKKYTVPKMTKQLEELYYSTIEGHDTEFISTHFKYKPIKPANEYAYGTDFKISVIVPTMNEERTIKRCLESLKEQTYPAHEIIVVDAHSNDKTIEIAKQHADKVVLDEKQGAAAARNLGAKIATGQVVAFIDGDTIPKKDWLERINENFKKGFVGVGGVVAPWKGDLSDDVLYYTTNNLMFRMTKQIKFYQFIGNNCAYLKTVYEKEPGFDEQLGPLEDLDLGLRIKKHCKLN